MPYSLIELLSAMTVFVLLMAALMQFLASAQKIWTGSNAKTVMFEDARTAMNLMARDLCEVFYTEGGSGGFSASSNNEAQSVAFSTRIDGKPNSSCKSNIAIVTWKYFDSSDSTAPCTLQRQILGDNAYSDLTYSTIAGALSPSSSADREVIERVVDFKISSYKKTSNFSAPDSTISEGHIPYLVTISLSLLDRDSYDKWIASGKLAGIKNSNMRTFTKYIFIGDRGQAVE